MLLRVVFSVQTANANQTWAVQLQSVWLVGHFSPNGGRVCPIEIDFAPQEIKRKGTLVSVSTVLSSALLYVWQGSEGYFTFKM